MVIDKKTQKLSFRVAIPVKGFLAEVAAYSGVTQSDLLRGCINYILTADPKHLPLYFREEPLGGLPPLNDVDEYQKIMG